MLQWMIYAMVYLGSALMVFNIYGFIRFAMFIRKHKGWEQKTAILYTPIALLILFLLGYLGIGLFGKPDLLTAGILFGGSVFVFIMYLLLTRITKRLLEQEKLQTQLLASEESTRAKTAFLASMSHEMRTPMNVILGLTAIERKRTDLPETTQEHLRKITRSGEHLLQMINNILDMNSLEGGSLKISEEVFFMGGMLKRIEEVAQDYCSAKGLTLQTRFADSVTGWYIGDESLIEQILLPIINNAAKYTFQPGTISLSARETVLEDQVYAVEFQIADTGIGIDEEFLPRIYEIFSQEDASSTSRFGGSGIGLAATKGKVDLLGGTISVQSKKGEGSVFTVILPVIPAEEPEEASASRDEVSGTGGPAPQAASLEETPGTEPLAGKRILIVEDIAENAEIVSDLLELEEVETDVAENGQIALEKFQSSSPYYYDAVLMDLRMPVMDGLEATRQIRLLQRPDAQTIPILALTANAFDNDIRQSLEAGMNAHLAKPADSQELYATLRKAIQAADKQEKGGKES